MIGAFAGDRRVGLYQAVALLVLAGAAVAVVALFGTEASVFSGTLAVDGFGGFAKLIIYAASFVCIAIAPRYFGDTMRAEYSALIVFAALGMGIMASSRDLKIGRASCRESGCQYVEISVVAESLKKKR